MLYFLAKHQKAQRLLYQEVDKVYNDESIEEVIKIAKGMPYMQACIKETLR